MRTMRRRYPVVLSAIESLESRRLMSADIRSVDGSGDNLAHAAWGQAGSDLLRLGPVGYSDGISTPALASDLSARTISNLLNDQASASGGDKSTVDENSLSDFGYAFGQFMDHDMDLTPDGGDYFNISVAATDPIGPYPLYFTRSVYDASTGMSTSNPRQQYSTVTAYLDLSQVYGSTQAVSDALRTFSGGQLKTGAGNMLPYDNTNYFTSAQIAALNMANDAHAVTTDNLFAAGDVRANENAELTVLQTLFLRNHNEIAAQLQKAHSNWTDEQVYQEARKLNIAQYQSIVYNEYLPAVYGQQAVQPYKGYNPKVNATIANEFSTVAFRMGHSMLSEEIELVGNNGQEVGDSLSLAEDFFDPNLLNPAGVVDPLTGHTSTDIGVILKGQASANGQAMDMMSVSDIRNLLFGNGGFGGEDLIARDVQRDRDNGIANYNALRVSLGFKPAKSFADITRDPTVQAALAKAYPGGVNTVDAFEGGMAEDPVPGSDVGPLFQAISVSQFARLRDGDRFFYLNESFNAEEKSILNAGNSLSEVIEANTEVRGLQANAMVFHTAASGVITALNSGKKQPAPNVRVQLVNDDGEVVATTVTDRNGRYVFTEQSKGAAADNLTPGLSASGSYSTVMVLPPNATAQGSTTRAFAIASGDAKVQGLDFQFVAKQGVGTHPSATFSRAPVASPTVTPVTTLASSLSDLLKSKSQVL